MRFPFANAVPDPLAQCVGRRFAGIDKKISCINDRAEQFTFLGDGIAEPRAFDGQRVFAAGLAEARHQHLVVCLKEQQLAGYTRKAQPLDQFGYLIDIVWPIARINTDGDIFKDAVTALQNMLQQRIEQAGWNIIDAIETEIFERMQCHALAGTRKAADDYKTHKPGIRIQP
jgi:hypothetical protein